MEKAKSKTRGFAGMSKERRAEIARRGGLAAHAKGTAHKWNIETAREAGKKGGAAVLAKHGIEYLTEIGTRGGLKRGINIQKKAKNNASA